MGIRAVIFDLDGCLVDSETMSLDILAEEMTAEGVPSTPDDLRRRFLGVSIQSIVAHVAQAAGRELRPDFAQRFEDRLLGRYESGLPLMPGATDLLDALEARGITTAIATGGSLRRLRATLQMSGLADRFGDRAFSADEVRRGKPAPDLFLLAAERLGIKPASCAVMEDSPHGIAGARTAGMHIVGFVGGSHLDGLREDHARRLRDAGADVVLDDLSSMLTALLTISETS